MHTANKVHKSAVAVIPSFRLTQTVQKLRCFKDKSFLVGAGNNWCRQQAAAAQAAVTLLVLVDGARCLIHDQLVTMDSFCCIQCRRQSNHCAAFPCCGSCSSSVLSTVETPCHTPSQPLQPSYTNPKSSNAVPKLLLGKITQHTQCVSCCCRCCLLLPAVFHHKRWPPHINLLYPFLEDQGGTFQSAAAAISHAVAHIAPFKVWLAVTSSTVGTVHRGAYTSVHIYARSNDLFVCMLAAATY